MKDVTFITGNQDKADYLAKHLGFALPHKKVDQEEIQSLDLHEIVTHKAKQAYVALGTPVLVEDVALEFKALGRLPGTFIKFFLEDMGDEGLCNLLDSKERSAIARCTFGYYDGTQLQLFDGQLAGRIADAPAGENGFGWDTIFIPEGYDITRAQMGEADDMATYPTIKPIAAVRQFLSDER